MIGSIAEIHNRYLGPLVFAPYAVHLAARVEAHAPNDILELAAGTGIVTRELAKRLPSARIIATDANREMIDYAAQRLIDRNIVCRQADPQALPFADFSFDAVVCQFGAMFFSDKVAVYREARRVLRPGGVLLFNVWDRIEENQFADEVMHTVAALYPKDPPQFFVRTPYGYNDERTIRAHLRDAGFTQVRIAPVVHMSIAENARQVAIALCQGTPLRDEVELRGFKVDATTNAAAAAIARRFGVGPVEGYMRALVVEAT